MQQLRIISNKEPLKNVTPHSRFHFIFPQTSETQISLDMTREKIGNEWLSNLRIQFNVITLKFPL